MEPKGKIYLTTMHHSDLTWQYSYDEYDRIREEQLNIVINFFSKYPEYGFIIDQAYVLQNYLQRNPEKKDEIEKLVNKGKGPFELVGGYAIPDMNLCSGESFIRNCMTGRDYYKEEFGYTPDTASLEDAFGMPMQIPQILAQLGYKYLMPGRMPNAPSDFDRDKSFIWNGYGQTKLVVVKSGGGVDKSSYETNVPVMYNHNERFVKTLTDLANTEGNLLAYYLTEIQMLDEAFFKHFEDVNNNSDNKRKVTFGRFADYCKTIDEKVLQSYQGEFNPIFTGCYTTRIGVKQKIRAAENALFAAELAAALTGGKIDLSSAWTQLHLGQFHDAACGCHHDVCNIDVNKKLDFVMENAANAYESVLKKGDSDSILVMNTSAYTHNQLIETTVDALPNGVPVQKDGSKCYFSAELPAYGIKHFDINVTGTVKDVKVCEAKAYCGKTDYFTFDFSEVSPKIKSNRYKHNVFGQTGFGEVIFRHESGSMWAETILEPPFGSAYQDESVVNVEEGEVFVRVTTQGSVKPYKKPISGNSGTYWTGFESLSFTKEYIFPLHSPHFKLRLTVNFAGCNTKISLRVPVEIDPMYAVALYDTPFAAIERKPYFEVPFKYESTMKALAKNSDYIHAKGDYPALHWVDYHDKNIGIAVANSGTPGHNIVGKDIFISLIRSGTRCLDGTMYPQQGSYDNGTYTFEFVFTDHLPENIETASWLGALLNRKPICMVAEPSKTVQDGSMMTFEQDNIIVSSIYPKNDSVVVRAYEGFGKTASAVINSTQYTQCYNADIYGTVIGPQDMSSIHFAPYEIKTFVLKK